MSLHPTNELVAVAWLKGVTGLGDRVATALPQDNTTWAASGFVTVTTVGGSPHMHLPIAAPVLSLDFWAVNPNSQSPPWNRANQLAEHVRAAVHEHATVRRTVAMPAAYLDATVTDAWLLTEPRRVHADPAQYAHFSADLALTWVEVPA